MQNTLLTIVLAPLIGALIAGLFGRKIGRVLSHCVTILGVALACGLSIYVLKQLLTGEAQNFYGNVYTWLVSDGVQMNVGFMVDHLTALMMVVVTFVSLCVHVYTIGYMHDDPGYQRFFAYISLFTFSMLMLVMANNFMQLFFGWEAVGVVSYLLIGFWYTRSTAIYASLKAFLVNRVGDFGFILGIAAVLYYTGSLDYRTVFAHAHEAFAGKMMEIIPGVQWSAITVACLCLFVGAMGKSAQMPLHVWLPDSMEGPTPISALIHAATMVTAGIFMVARMSPLFEMSETALNSILIIGASTAFFMGLLGMVNNDIKRVIAYSTLSQLGYMTVGLGASAYAGAIFHLMTHAFFKALLFLAAGSVIIGMHHEQDMRKMGGLKKYMPITYWTSLIGSLALIAFPGTSGFFSKDVLIDAVHESHLWAAPYAYWCVFLSVFVTAFYSFRLIFMTFHGEERFAKSHDAHHEDTTEATTIPDARSKSGSQPVKHDDHGHDVHEQADDHHDHHSDPPHESPWVVTVPLILLAIPSLFIGWFTVQPILFGNYFGSAIQVDAAHNALAEVGHEFHSPAQFLLDSLSNVPVWLALFGVFIAWLMYIKKPELQAKVANALSPLYKLLINKFYFDEIYFAVFAKGSRNLGKAIWVVSDAGLIDGVIVNGSARTIGWFASIVRGIQTGRLYGYAFTMIIGLAALLGWFVVWPIFK